MLDKVNIKIYTINNISNKFKDRLKKLSFGNNGYMASLLDLFTKDYYMKGYIVCAYSDSKLIGWSLFSSHKMNTIGFAKSNDYCSINIFVDKTKRNNGVGKKIMLYSANKIHKLFNNKKIGVYPHDFYSHKLFDSISKQVLIKKF